MLSAAQIIALTIFCESANQGEHGMQAVASVIWNRAKVKNAMELAAVCTTRKQFSCWDSHYPDYDDIAKATKDEPSMAAYTRAKEIAVSMVNGTFKPCIEATHYHRFDIAPWWSSALARVCRIGDHVFLKEV